MAAGQLAQVVIGTSCGRDILLALYGRAKDQLTGASGQLDLRKEMSDHRSMAQLGQCLLDGTSHTDLMDILRGVTRELKADVLTEACDGVIEDLIAILDRPTDDTVLTTLVERFLQSSTKACNITRPLLTSSMSEQITNQFTVSMVM